MGKKKDGIQETPQQRAMVEHAAMQLDDYKRRWLPLQQRMAAQIDEMGAEGSVARERAQGRAATETAAKFGQARAGMEKAFADRRTGGAGSAAFKLGETGLSSDEATSKGMGMFAANSAVDDAYVQGLGALSAIGRGEKASAMQGETKIAAMSGQQAAQDASIALQNQMSTAGMVGQVAGAGMSAYANRGKSTTPNTAQPGAGGGDIGANAWEGMYNASAADGYGGMRP